MNQSEAQTCNRQQARENVQPTPSAGKHIMLRAGKQASQDRFCFAPVWLNKQHVSGPYLGFFCLRGKTPHTFTGVSRIQTETNIATRNTPAKSNTMLEKKTFGFPGGGNRPPPPASPLCTALRRKKKERKNSQSLYVQFKFKYKFLLLVINGS